MHAVSAFEAKNKLATLLDRVEQGEEVLITRHGKAVARLVPATPKFDRNNARQATHNLMESSRDISLKGLEIKDLVNEDRP
ncbi:MAG: type II toxin-antitoxin system prevent-host-death family antitoxin [Burkholderiales bacterium]